MVSLLLLWTTLLGDGQNDSTANEARKVMLQWVLIRLFSRLFILSIIADKELVGIESHKPLAMVRRVTIAHQRARSCPNRSCTLLLAVGIA